MTELIEASYTAVDLFLKLVKHGMVFITQQQKLYIGYKYLISSAASDLAERAFIIFAQQQYCVIYFYSILFYSSVFWFVFLK